MPGARAAVVVSALACALGLAAVSSTSRAQEAKATSGVVLALDAGDVVVDLGNKQGVANGAVLELWRPLKLKHPVTGKLVSDRFRIGTLKVVQAREVMSLAKPSGPLERPVEPGDVVIVPGPPPMVTPPSPASPTGSAPPVIADPDPEARALGALFEGMHGASPEERADAYEAWVRANPTSRFAGVLQEEALALRNVAAAMAPKAKSPPKPTISRVEWSKVDQALEAAPLTLGVELRGPVTGAVLHVRAADEPAYTPIPMSARGGGYYAATLPEGRVRAPTLSWFVEAVSADGKARMVLGSPGDPNVTRVVPAPRAGAPLKHENVLTLWTDYADYNRLRGNDWAWQTEGFFGMRFGDVGVRAVRSGFGVYRGKGGSLAELDEQGLAPRSVGLSYGYVEGELGINTFWALVGRAMVGLGKDEVKSGGQAFVRIGNDKRTNLLVGGEFLGGIGLRGISQLELALFPRIPILVRSEVTNQPAGVGASTLGNRPLVSTQSGDIGVRAIVQVGYRMTPGFALFVRGSYQGRTINHAGPGFGAGASVAW